MNQVELTNAVDAAITFHEQVTGTFPQDVVIQRILYALHILVNQERIAVCRQNVIRVRFLEEATGGGDLVKGEEQ